jgi:hypothetical protein
MKKFRKKPVVIEAEQWLGTDEQKKKFLAKGFIMDLPSRDGSCLVPTIEGNVTCTLNDYIVKDEHGLYFVFNCELFESLYELEEEATLEIKVNAETLALNPEFVEAGIEVGDTITVDAVDPIEEAVPVEVEKKKAAKK